MTEDGLMAADDVKPTSDQREPPGIPVSHASTPDSENTPAETTNSRYPLRGKPVRLIDPTQPVSADEWEATE